MATDSNSQGVDSTKLSAESSQQPGWQYSLRGLLLVITIASITLAVGVHFQGLMVAVVAIGIVQAAILLAGDWLIQRRNRWALALLTSVFWAIPGCGLLLLGIGAAFGANAVEKRGASAAVAALAIAAGAICYLMAVRRWRQLTADNGLRRTAAPHARSVRH
jgi:hypothetical protein